jgi:hypothetical protein
MKEIVLNVFGSELITEVGNYLQLSAIFQNSLYPPLAIIANTP